VELLLELSHGFFPRPPDALCNTSSLVLVVDIHTGGENDGVRALLSGI